MRVIRVGPVTDVQELADLLDVPAVRVVEAGFRVADRLLTMRDEVTFVEAARIAAEFDAVAEPR